MCRGSTASRRSRAGLTGRVAALAARAGELEQDGGVRGGGGTGHGGGNYTGRRMDDEATRANQAALQAMAAGNMRGPGRASRAPSRVVAGTCGCGSISPWCVAQRRDLDGAFQALRRCSHRWPQLPGPPDERVDAGKRRPGSAGRPRLRRRTRERSPGSGSRCAYTAGGRARASVHGAYTGSSASTYATGSRMPETRCSQSERDRLDAFIDMTLHVRRRYRQEPMEYGYPGLPAIEFYERREFPWLPELEAATAAIGQELLDPRARTQPALRRISATTSTCRSTSGASSTTRRAGAPSTSTKSGHNRRPTCPAPRPSPAVRRAAPGEGRRCDSPTAMFSVLKPRTRIPPHTGVAQLPPRGSPARSWSARACGFRVGGETREWRIGEAWVFDDTIEHEAWNDSDEPRVVLILDVWSPRLSPEERTAIAVIAATDAFNGTVPGR